LIRVCSHADLYAFCDDSREGLGLEDTFKGRRVLVSGSGNVAQYAALKAIELGAKVLSLSDSTGSLIANDAEGFTKEDIYAIAAVKVKRQSITAAGLKNYKYHEGSRPWTLVDKVDIALPSATQNEISEDEAKALIKAGCKYVAEGSNMVHISSTSSRP
jgi:glutamate dehydrogenase (NADP+)